MIFVLGDRYESPSSIDAKKVPVAFHLTSQWRRMTLFIWSLHIRRDNLYVKSWTCWRFKFACTILDAQNNINLYIDKCMLSHGKSCFQHFIYNWIIVCRINFEKFWQFKTCPTVYLLKNYKLYTECLHNTSTFVYSF